MTNDIYVLENHANAVYAKTDMNNGAMRCVLVCPRCLAESGNVSKKKLTQAKDTISHCGGRCWKWPIRDRYWIEGRIRKRPIF